MTGYEWFRDCLPGDIEGPCTGVAAFMACWDAAQAEKQPETDELKAEVERLEIRVEQLKIETERSLRTPISVMIPFLRRIKCFIGWHWWDYGGFKAPCSDGSHVLFGCRWCLCCGCREWFMPGWWGKGRARWMQRNDQGMADDLLDGRKEVAAGCGEVPK